MRLGCGNLRCCRVSRRSLRCYRLSGYRLSRLPCRGGAALGGFLGLVGDGGAGQVVHHVQLGDLRRGDGVTQASAQVCLELFLVADCTIGGNGLSLIGRDRGAARVENRDEADQGSHEAEGDVRRANVHTCNHADREGYEVVTHLALAQGGGTQSDNRQDTEEAHTHSGCVRSGGYQRHRDGEDAGVDDRVGNHQFAVAVPHHVEGAERCDGYSVGECHGQNSHWVLQVSCRDVRGALCCLFFSFGLCVLCSI